MFVFHRHNLEPQPKYSNIRRPRKEECGQRHAPASLPQERALLSNEEEAGRAPGPFWMCVYAWRTENLLPPLGFEAPTVHSAANRYADYAIPAQIAVVVVVGV